MKELTPAEILHYDRQIRLAEVGIERQKLLKNARVLVVGAGGLGSPVLFYLAAAGIGKLGVIDHDIVEESNLHRQILFGSKDIGEAKVERAYQKLSDLNPLIDIDKFKLRLAPQNIAHIFADYDIIVDGSDSFETRYLVNDACVVLGKTLVSGSIFRFEGQLSVFNMVESSGLRGPTLRCLYPTPPIPNEVPTCADIGVLGVIPGIIGTLLANEVIKIVTAIGEPLSGRLMLFDGLRNSFKILSFERDQTIVRQTKILDKYNFQCKESCMDSVKQITPSELLALHKIKKENGEPLILLDVREPFEREQANIGGLFIPMNQIVERISDIPEDCTVVVYCKSGGRSRKAIEFLQESGGFLNLINLSGGITRWREEIDPSVSLD